MAKAATKCKQSKPKKTDIQIRKISNGFIVAKQSYNNYYGRVTVTKEVYAKDKKALGSAMLQVI